MLNRDGARGFVHVLDRKGFEHFRHDEWRSPGPVEPVAVVEVTADDLPEGIHIVEGASDVTSRGP